MRIACNARDGEMDERPIISETARGTMASHSKQLHCNEKNTWSVATLMLSVESRPQMSANVIDVKNLSS